MRRAENAQVRLRGLGVRAAKREAATQATAPARVIGEGKILENHRDRQRKRIKYIHLVTNCLIYHNVYQLTEVLKQLEAEGHHILTEALPFINPYMTGHINRLGKYVLNLERKVPEADYGYKPGETLEGNLQKSGEERTKLEQ